MKADEIVFECTCTRTLRSGAPDEVTPNMKCPAHAPFLPPVHPDHLCTCGHPYSRHRVVEDPQSDIVCLHPDHADYLWDENGDPTDDCDCEGFEAVP